ncbi:MAG: sulfotransferase domain-containing protein [bacterium]|nr:sulfotransferase domain-containing protein [bacterium]
MLKKFTQRLAGLSVPKVKRKLKYLAMQSRSKLVRPSYRTPVRNIYHCTVHKSGSQWIRNVMQDWRVYKYSGLRAHHYESFMPNGIDSRRIPERVLPSIMPESTAVTPIYSDLDSYRQSVKPGEYRGIFVVRDPRDVVVSWYFSARYSHRPMGRVLETREVLGDLPQPEGLKYAIDWLADFGLFDAVGSWFEPGALTDKERIFRYEDLNGPNGVETFGEIFKHCDIRLPEKVLVNLVADHSFENLSGGRRKGEEDKQDHLRKGVVGDWKNHFTPEVEDHFTKVTGDLILNSGYEPFVARP